ncbi:MAG: sigma-54-dependent Fis family transcriptional regulator [Planctomycetes bacterium]|nr:sigma-54-dependent Fis family transcriptional regulator [Planctomycetota bacterium]
METQRGETGTVANLGDAPQILSECWSTPLIADEVAPPLYHALTATSILNQPSAPTFRSDADSSVENAASALQDRGREILRRLIDLLKAERAFLFVTQQEATDEGETVRAETALALNVDGEPVVHPERRVNLDVVRSTAATSRPIGRLDESAPEQENSASYFVSLPLELQGNVVGVLVIDNRFSPLAVSHEALLTVRMYCQVLSVLLDLDRLRRENSSLWNDVTILRESPNPSTKLSAYWDKQASSQKAKNTNRNDLKGDYSMIVGSSPRMIEIFQILDRISSSNAPVLINGESGTGKELIANAIHKNSTRVDQPFVSENCGALTETLLESELFGYMKGAFTGAAKDRKGLFELATGGTLFLDEVGDMSPGMQKKLLRVLQEKVVRRVGGKELIPVDVRIISATNKDLQDEVLRGNFREDLYYRLNVIKLKLPPLRERKEDVQEIVEYFLGLLGQENGLVKDMDETAMGCLVDYEWPGNIRELQNEVKRLYALSEDTIQVHDLSETILQGGHAKSEFKSLERDLLDLTLKEAVERVEERMIRHALIELRGNKSLVAKKLQVPKTSLYNKINKYGLNRI